MPLQPYFAGGLENEVHALVGFDIERTITLGFAWLEKHEYVVDGNSRLPPRSAPHSKDEAKAHALLDEIDDLRSLQWMYGPERIASARWLHALGDVDGELEAFLTSARIRYREDVHHDGHRTGPRAHEMSDHTASVVAAAESFLALVREATRKADIVADDGLPAPRKPNRPRMDYLASMEARLSLAGFTYPEIADLIPDLKQIENERRTKPLDVDFERDAHTERIRSRCTKKKAGIEKERVELATVQASIDEWKARTGFTMGKDVRKWFDSPEHRALPAELRGRGPDELWADPPTGE
jgi:hypothetical protein